MLRKIDREAYFKATVLFLLFLLLAFDRDMAMIYILMILGDFLWWRFDRNVSFPIEKTTDNRVSAFLVAAIATYGFLLANMLVLNILKFDAEGPVTLNSVLQLFSTSTPILQGNVLLTIIGWGLLIPIIETTFFNGTLLEGLTEFASKQFNKTISLRQTSIALIIVMAVLSALFALFHITAKNLASGPLILTFIFSMASSILVVRYGELKQAILFHIMVNTLAVLSVLKLLPNFI